MYSEPLKHTLSPCKGPFEFFQFYLKSTQRTVNTLIPIYIGFIALSPQLEVDLQYKLYQRLKNEALDSPRYYQILQSF